MTSALHSAVAGSVQPYIHSVFPANGTQNVSTHVLIQIQFQSICQNVAIGEENVLTLKDSSGDCQLHSQVADQCFAQPEQEGKDKGGVPLSQGESKDKDKDRDMDMEGRLGGEEARRRGFARWLRPPSAPTSGSPLERWGGMDQRLFVLEAREGEREKVLRNRYEFSPWRGRNGRYSGGDCYSWQRYTDKEPLSGVVEVLDGSTEGRRSSGQTSVLFRPSAPLRPNTTYVVVVTNGVDVVSTLRSQGGASSSADGSSRLSSRTEDDALFFFSTEPARAHIKGGRTTELSRSEGSVVEGNSHDAYGEDGGGYSGTMCYGLGSRAGDDPPLCAVS